MTFPELRKLFFVRSGFFYKIGITILVYCGLHYLNIAFCLLYGFLENDPGFVEFIYKDFITYTTIFLHAAMAIIVRYSLNGFEKLLSDKKFKNLFSKDQNYNDFVSSIDNFVKRKWEIISLILGSLIYIGALVVPYIIKNEFIISGKNYFDSPYLIVSFVAIMSANLLRLLAMISFCFFVIVFIRTFRLLTKNKDKLSLSSNITEISASNKKQSELKIGYEEFYYNQQILGNYLFNISLRFIGFSILITCVIIYNVFIGIAQWDKAIFVIPIALGLFVILISLIPQLVLHKVLLKAKKDTIDNIRKEYFKIKKKLFDDVLNMKGVVDEKSLTQLTFLELHINSISKLSTWSYDFSTALKVGIGSSLSIIPSVVSIIIEYSR
ncbi:MAG: hypothetical protein ACTSYH_06005 [Candidatus Heimdallarchaeaceae archaeon]